MDGEDEVVRAWTPLAAKITRRIVRAFPHCRRDFEDLLQVALWALVLAARKYDAAVGLPFAQFAGLVVKRRVIVEARRLSLRPAAQLQGADADRLTSPRRPQEPGERDDAEALLARLEPARAAVLRAWAAGETDREQAARLGCTHQAVSKWRSQALDALRRHAEAKSLAASCVLRTGGVHYRHRACHQATA
jgi:DNA-directed RNA polymerase specialized sigma subunit